MTWPELLHNFLIGACGGCGALATQAWLNKRRRPTVSTTLYVEGDKVTETTARALSRRGPNADGQSNQ